MDVATKYRIKALACERLSKQATEPDLKTAWAEIAIEWHTLSNRVAQQDSHPELDHK